jgi:hypothetical protein
MTGTRLVSSLTAGLTVLVLTSPVQAAPAEIPNQPPATPDPAEPPEEEPDAAPVDTRPYTMDYELGQPIPLGYRVVSRPHRAELTLGSILFGISYTVSAILAASRTEASGTAESFLQVPYDPRWLYVPIIGPWVALATSFMSPDCRNSYFTSSYFYGECESATGEQIGPWRAFLVADGLAQGAGTALAIYGFKWRWHQLVLIDDVQVQVLPVPMGTCT